MKPCTNRIKSMAGALCLALATPVVSVRAQQVPIPQTPADVTGPSPGPMTKAYITMVGRMAYLWDGRSST